MPHLLHAITNKRDELRVVDLRILEESLKLLLRVVRPVGTAHDQREGSHLLLTLRFMREASLRHFLILGEGRNVELFRLLVTLERPGRLLDGSTSEQVTSPALPAGAMMHASGEDEPRAALWQ